jgi:hypothetical protein
MVSHVASFDAAPGTIASLEYVAFIATVILVAPLVAGAQVEFFCDNSASTAVLQNGHAKDPRL